MDSGQWAVGSGLWAVDSLERLIRSERESAFAQRDTSYALLLINRIPFHQQVFAEAGLAGARGRAARVTSRAPSPPTATPGRARCPRSPAGEPLRQRPRRPRGDNPRAAGHNARMAQDLDRRSLLGLAAGGLALPLLGGALSAQDRADLAAWFTSIAPIASGGSAGAELPIPSAEEAGDATLWTIDGRVLRKSDLGDFASGRLLREAARLSTRAAAGPSGQRPYATGPRRRRESQNPAPIMAPMSSVAVPARVSSRRLSSPLTPSTVSAVSSARP